MPSNAEPAPVSRLREVAKTLGIKLRRCNMSSANLPGGALVTASTVLDGRRLRFFAGPTSVEIGVQAFGVGRFSINRPNYIWGDERPVGLIVAAMPVSKPIETALADVERWCLKPERR